jgi:hypothetical protein
MKERRLAEIIQAARKAAIEYRRLTGKPLGITGEIGECEAAKLLRLRLQDARSTGCDAIDKDGKRVEIKTRCVPRGRPLSSQRIGRINLTPKFDAAVLVLLDEDFKPVALYRAPYAKLVKKLKKPRPLSHHQRTLTVSQFKAAGLQVWPRPSKTRQ